MRNKLSRVLLFGVCIYMGILMTLLMNDSEVNILGSTAITTPKVIYDYDKEISNLEIEKMQLKEQVESLENKLENYQNEEEIDYEQLSNQLYNELTNYDIITGKVDVKGQGVQIIMSDSDEKMEPGDNISNYIIHNSDILEMVNELKFAGAEVIAINGYQLSWDSNIDCAGPVIYIDDFIAGTPFTIEAIGDKEKLIANLKAEDSYFTELTLFSKINLTLLEKDEIVLKKN